MGHKEPEKTVTPPPSFLKELISNNEENILLIYQKIDPNNELWSPTRSEQSEEANSSMDLTGNPLNVDLSVGDCTLNVSLAENEDKWQPEELIYGGLDRTTLIKSINSVLAERKLNLGIYALCNGENKNKMVVQGMKQSENNLIRYQVFIMGNCGIAEGNERLSFLKNEHLKDLDGMAALGIKTELLITSTHVLYGSINSSHFSGLIICNITWSSFDYDIPKYVDSIHMIIKTIPGHKASMLHQYFKELSHLKFLINLLIKSETYILSVTLNEATKSFEFLNDFEVIFSNSHRPESELKDSLNFQNLRDYQTYITDILWNYFSQCKTVQDLKLNFESLFQDLAAAKYSVYPHNFTEYESSRISKILREISHGKLAVPTLTPVQSLSLLIECGIEKLKRDYSYILVHCNCLRQTEIEKLWELPKEEIKNKVSRSTFSNRFTSKFSCGELNRMHETPLNYTDALKKYQLLLSMHVACDVLALTLNYTGLSSVKEKIRTKLLNNEINGCLNKPYFEIECKLDKNFLKYVQQPTNLKIKFSSSHKRDTIETIFYHTANKLFPPTIFDDYEPVEEDKPCYYVSKIVSFNTSLS